MLICKEHHRRTSHLFASTVTVSASMPFLALSDYMRTLSMGVRFSSLFKLELAIRPGCM